MKMLKYITWLKYHICKLLPGRTKIILFPIQAGALSHIPYPISHIPGYGNFLVFTFLDLQLSSKWV